MNKIYFSDVVDFALYQKIKKYGSSACIKQTTIEKIIKVIKKSYPDNIISYYENDLSPDIRFHNCKYCKARYYHLAEGSTSDTLLNNSSIGVVSVDFLKIMLDDEIISGLIDKENS